MPLALREKITSWLWQLLEHRLIGPVQPIDIVRQDGTVETSVLAVVDSTEEFSSIDKDLVKQLGLSLPETADEIEYAVQGKTKLVPVIPITFRINGQTRTGGWAVVSRSHEKHLVSLGKKDTAGFLIELADIPSQLE